MGRSDSDRQYVFINSRPVDIPRINRVMNEMWRRYAKLSNSMYMTVQCCWKMCLAGDCIVQTSTASSTISTCPVQCIHGHHIATQFPACL